jgi:hypothetical protein
MKTAIPGTGQTGIGAPAREDNERRIVLVYSRQPPGNPDGHESTAQGRIAARLSELLGHEFGGEYEAGRDYGLPLYAVPRDTIDSIEEAARLGIHGESDLFGGVVPYPFIASKLITHPLLHAGAAAPAGWSREFGERVRDSVLPGYSAFSLADALAAGDALLKEGAVRVKKPSGIGGLGQSVARSAAELRQQLEEMGEAGLREEGVVLERNLVGVITRSVGQVRVGRQVASYTGIQHLTINNTGEEVYGGSDLLVANGDFEALLALEHEPAVHASIAQACAYHRAALACFAGMYTSRANYDIAEGEDEAGRKLCGVLEQSWRMGGATGAELAALAAFQADPTLRAVRTSTREVYGENVNIPPGAAVYYQGMDKFVGAITKFTTMEDHAYP